MIAPPPTASTNSQRNHSQLHLSAGLRASVALPALLPVRATDGVLRGEWADSTVWACIDEKAYPDWSVRAVFVADRTTRSAHVVSWHVEHYEGKDAPPTGNARMMHAVRPG